MKKTLRVLSRTILLYLVTLAIFAGGVLAYEAATFSGQVIILEPVGITETEPFFMEMYPGEVEVVNMELNNDSDVPVVVAPTYSINPDPGQVMWIEMPAQVTIPGGSSTVVTAQVFAAVSALPGQYEVLIIFVR